MKKMKGFTLIELLIVVAIIAILAAIAVPNFLEAQIRSKVSRAKSDMRSLATAVESYMVDTNVYFFSRPTKVNAPQNFYRLTFAQRRAGDLMMTLTTPVAYITALPNDPFADIKGTPFMYSNGGMIARKDTGWIMASYGPDLDQKTTDGDLTNETALVTSDTNPDAIQVTVYDASMSQPSMYLLTGYNTVSCGSTARGAYTYDPTNGTTSDGDVYRVKE